MASGSKTRNVFTEENMGTGKSSGIVDSKGRVDGQTIKMAYPQDNQHGLRLENERGGPVRGGVTNLEHSLKGASAVQDGPGAAGAVKHTRIKDH